VTGVDFSIDAIKAARSLAQETGVPAEFVCCNIYGLREHLAGQFDIVYASYGVMCWLPDLREWARIIAHFLREGGFLYVADTHPINRCIQYDEAGAARLEGDYFAPTRAELDGTPGPDYANPEYIQTTPEYTWWHTAAELLNSLIEARLRIDFFREWPGYNMEPCPDGTWREVKDKAAQYPMVFSLKASKD
jgi:SAM-dependent methyltransferase